MNIAFTNLIDQNGHAEIPAGTTKIPMRAFKDCRELKSVSIPDTVTEIQISAFEECRSLVSIIIPDSVQRIACKCFAGSGISEITLPGKLTKIETGVFSNCKSLQRIALPKTIAEIEENAFSHSGLTEFTISKNIKINKSVLANCEQLAHVDIEEGVETIGPYSFYGCSSLSGISLPNSLTCLQDSAFMNTGLVEITIPEGVKEIGASCFCSCTRLVRVTLPNSLREIGPKAFSYCKSLTDLVIPESVMTLGLGSFYNCTSLKNLVLPNKMDDISKRGQSLLGQGTFENCNALPRIDIPEGVKTLHPLTFCGCSSVHIHISSTVQSWYLDLPYSRNDVKDISISPDNESFSVESHCLVHRKSRTLCLISRSATAWPDNISTFVLPEAFLPPFIDVESLVIPEGVTHIERLPFKKMTKLRRLILPLSLKSCGKPYYNYSSSQRDPFMADYPFPDISVTPDMFLCENFTGWREISKVNLIGIDEVNPELLDKIKEKYKKDKSFCIYLNGQLVYPAAHIVRKKEETIAERVRKEAEAKLESKKQEMTEKMEDTTIEALCVSTLGSVGFTYEYNADNNVLTVTILGEFKLWCKLAIATASENLVFVMEVATAYRNALKEFIDSSERSSAGIGRDCRPGEFNVRYQCLGGDWLTLGTTSEYLHLGPPALEKAQNAFNRLSQKYGDKMNSIKYSRIY